jgi:hypothetical protein
MAKAEVVGEVAMLVVADAGKFATDLQKKVKKAVSKVANSKTFAALTQAAGKAGEEAGEAFSRGIDRKGRLRAKRTGTDTAKSFAGGLIDGIRAATPSIVATAGTAVESVANAFKTGFNLAGSGIQGVVGAVASLASSGPVGIAIAIAALIAGFIALVTIGPAVIATLTAIGAALASLVGLIGAAPATIGILVAAFGPLILAFQGFGEAVGALAEGDMEKFNEALEKLSPSARRVAREFKALMPFFKELQQIAQENLFSSLVGQVERLGKVLGPVLKRGVGGVTSEFGTLLGNIGTTLARPESVRTLDRLFQTVTRIIAAFNLPVSNFLLSIINAIDASLPSVETFFTKLAGGLDSFANFITQSTEDGSFQKFLDRAFETLDTIWTLITNIGAVLADVFLDPALQETGLAFFDAVNDALAEMHEFFQSEEGKQFLRDLNTLAQHFIETLRDIGPVVAWVLEQIATVIRGAAKLLRLIDLIRGRSSNNFGGIGAAVGAAGRAGAGFAMGGEVDQDGLYRLGEGNRREVILPMTNPTRARKVAEETGVTDMLRGMGGDGVALDVTVLLGTREITDIVDTQVTRSNRAQARALANGPRME